LVTTAPTRGVLFLSSYSPLFVILGIRALRENAIVAVLLMGLAGLSVGFLLTFLSLMRQLAPHQVRVSESQSRDVELIGYILTYLLPFLDISFSEFTSLVPLGLFILVIAVLYINSNMIHVNPILNLLGYHILEIHSEDGKTSALICRRRYIRAGTTLNVASLGDYVLLESGT